MRRRISYGSASQRLAISPQAHSIQSDLSSDGVHKNLLSSASQGCVATGSCPPFTFSDASAICCHSLAIYELANGTRLLPQWLYTSFAPCESHKELNCVVVVMSLTPIMCRLSREIEGNACQERTDMHHVLCGLLLHSRLLLPCHPPRYGVDIPTSVLTCRPKPHVRSRQCLCSQTTLRARSRQKLLLKWSISNTSNVILAQKLCSKPRILVTLQRAT